MIKAVIFDMDGLMIETEHLQSKSFEYVLKNHGVEPKFNTDGVVQKVGITSRDNFIMLKKKHGITSDLETMLALKQKYYKKLLLQNIVPKEGLLVLIKILKASPLKIAIASSSSLEHIQIVVQQLKLSKAFDAIVSGESIEKGKPYPDIFLEAANKLHIKPENCLVLEDAESGVEAAYAAGMKVIAIANHYTRSHNFAKATARLASLKEVDLDLIASL